MKRVFVFAILMIGFSASAHAQAMSKPTNAAWAGSGAVPASGGASGSASAPIPHIPATHYNVTAASGSAADFVPSSFVTFEQAVAAGHAAQARPKTIVEAAAENKSVERPKAKFELVQDDSGQAVIEPL